MPKKKLDLVPGTLELLVLKVLTIGPMHGYAITRRLAQTSEEVVRVEEGSLYPALHRMAKRGWITAEWGASEANRRAKFYRLTARGRRQLEEKQAAWERMAGAIARVLASAFAEQGA
jgi:transcriptional regulator